MNNKTIKIKGGSSNYHVVINKISAVKFVDDNLKEGCVYLDSGKIICGVNYSYLNEIVDKLNRLVV